MSSSQSMAHDEAMHRYEEQYDALKAKLQAVGFIGQGSVQTRRIACGVAHLPLPSRPGRPPRPLPLLDAEGPRKNRRLEAHRRRTSGVSLEQVDA